MAGDLSVEALARDFPLKFRFEFNPKLILGLLDGF